VANKDNVDDKSKESKVVNEAVSQDVSGNESDKNSEPDSNQTGEKQE
jgi:hypothetical protein